MNSCFKIVLFFIFLSRAPSALADVFEKKNKTTSVYRLIVLKTTGFEFQVSKTIILHTCRLVRCWLSSFKTFTSAYFFSIVLESIAYLTKRAYHLQNQRCFSIMRSLTFAIQIGKYENGY